MDTEKIEQLKEKFWAIWNDTFNRPDEEGVADVGREKFVVFLVALVLALCMWLMVNLSRDYNLNVNLPIALGNIPSDRALTEELPKFATVSIMGEGWKLINIYNSPPRIYVDVTEQEISLYDQVRQQINAIPDLSVLKVQPLFLNVELEEKVSKKVPVQSNVRVSFEDQYGFIGDPGITPDSVVVSGASSLIEDITHWETDSVKIDDVSDSISAPVSLKQPDNLLSLSRNTVNYHAQVSQYTEGKAKIFIQTRNIPQGRLISFSPSSITVRYNVPINEYSQVQDLTSPFIAYVNYRQIRQDSTGFVIPQVEKSVEKYHYKLRSFNPEEVAYFTVIGD